MTEAKPTFWAEVDEQGRLILPPETAAHFGLAPGTRARLDVSANDIRLHRPVTHLAKVYVEPTNRCNIACRTCMRNTWDVPLGRMSKRTFARILDSLTEIGPPLTVFFGGVGEPLAHRETVHMVRQVKALGMTVELITNGTLLTEDQAGGLIKAGLDVLWVSIDGASPESYADVRLGAELPNVLANLARFRQLRPPAHRPRPEIGINFVAMQRNIHDLPDVLTLGKRYGASRFMVSNVLPYTEALAGETLYQHTLNDITYLPSPWLRRLSLPKMDVDAVTGPVLLKALTSSYNVTFAGNNLGVTNDVCTFIESGAIAVGWDGRVAPCPPLLYTHTHQLRHYTRTSHEHIIGSINEHSLREMWLDPEYIAYRERVHSFAFAPCTTCGGCEMSLANETDCFSNVAPACGGCLWAQGVIQCP